MAGARELIFDIFAVDRASATLSRIGMAAEGTGKKFDNVGKVMQNGMMAAGAVVAAVAIKSVEAAGNYEAAVTRLQTSAGESASNLKMVSDGMLDLTGKVGYSADELAKGMYIIESAGHHGADGLNVLKAAAQGARTENAELGTVADAVTTIMRDFGPAAGDAATITGKLIAATSVGKTNFEQLSGAMSAVMPRAAALHMNFSEISADLASMTAHGMSAEQSAQNMNDALKHLAGPTLAQAKAMADFGIQAHDVSQGLSKRGLAGTMQMLSDAIMSRMGPAGAQLKTVFNQSKLAAQDAKLMYDNLSPALRKMADDYVAGRISMHDWTVGLKNLDAPSASLLKQWASQENASKGFSNTLKSGGDTAKSYAAALQAVTGDQASMTVAMMLSGENAGFVNQNIKTVTGTVKDAKGAVAGFAEQQATLNGKMQDFKGALSALSVRLGNDLLPAMKSLATEGLRAVDWMEKHKTATEVMMAALAGAAGVILVVKGALAAYSMWQGISTAATALSTSTFGTWVGVMALQGVAALKGVIAAVREWTVVQTALDFVLDANPISIIIIAIAALVAGIIYAYQNSETFRNIVSTAFTVVKTAAMYLALGAVMYFHMLANVWMTVAGAILDGAAFAFQWVPGLGPKLQGAAAQFHKFKDAANAELDKIQSDINLQINTGNANAQMTAFYRQWSGKTIEIQANMHADVGNLRTQPGHASGGFVRAGVPVTVGENHPETFIPAVDGTINPHRPSVDMGGSQRTAPLVNIENYHEGTQSPDQIAASLMFRARFA